MLQDEEALVLFSGGQDSATCLAWALQRYSKVETIGFDYGQRHSVELNCRLPIIDELKKHKSEWKKKLGDDHLIDLKVLGDISQTSLTKPVEIEMSDQGLPNTFVPGRNLMFLTLAASVAYRRGIKNLVTGVCETDYSGYPDCRDDTIKAMQVALNLGMETRFVLHTPLMWIDKASTWRMVKQLGGSGLIELIKEYTHTCYNGDRLMRHEWGYGCNECPACELRSIGYQKFIS